MSTTTRELRAVHFVDGLLGNARDARGASPVSPVELSELLLSPGAEARARSSPSKVRAADRRSGLSDRFLRKLLFIF